MVFRIKACLVGNGYPSLARDITPRRDITKTPEGLICQRPWLCCASWEGNNHSCKARLTMNIDKLTEPSNQAGLARDRLEAGGTLALSRCACPVRIISQQLIYRMEQIANQRPDVSRLIIIDGPF